MKLLLLSSWFQLLWFAAVLGQQSLQWLLVFAVLITIFISVKRQSLPLIKWLSLFIVGITVDSFNQWSGLLVFSTPWLPYWLVALWGIFFWYAYQMMTIVNQYPISIVSVIGGISGGLSYYAGLKFDAVAWSYPIAMTISVLMIEWFLLCFLVIKVYQYDQSLPAKQDTSSLPKV
ncbi:hypothetical protein BCU68_01625 [Vibrio sp. 10N.286.49.B3]|uniref:DUF2878 domain-containing protein n=1 Tax=Vibrio sp. 10N.286.49.B3 TaxID=1880855 RepID=UPI000C848C4F|nr:DUF2878 domain-containing protein [Vibrio sp. 10N.286.49.B3]PMH46760.1 hypothetical protein BCU68_01625 [Vibrio sp. 10N.286.49.B3]